MHSHEGILAKSVGAGPKGIIWQPFYFRLEPSRLAYYTPSLAQQQQFQLPPPQQHQQGEETKAEEEREGLGPHAGQFLLEEVLSVNSRGQLCEIEIRDNHDNMHLLRANSKYALFLSCTLGTYKSEIEDKEIKQIEKKI